MLGFKQNVKVLCIFPCCERATHHKMAFGDTPFESYPCTDTGTRINLLIMLTDFRSSQKLAVSLSSNQLVISAENVNPYPVTIWLYSNPTCGPNPHVSILEKVKATSFLPGLIAWVIFTPSAPLQRRMMWPLGIKVFLGKISGVDWIKFNVKTTF